MGTPRTIAGIAAVTAVVIAWALWPLLTLSSVPKWDGLTFYGPAFSLLADHLRGGELQLWNPWVGGGRPDAADPQVGVFSPYLLLMALLTGGGFRGYALTLAIAWWLAPVGVLFLGRHLRAPLWGSIAAALAFAACGFFTGHLEHFTFTLAMAAVPWITWRLDAAVCRPSLLAAVQAGAIWGLAGLSGYPGVTICTGLWIGLWVLGRWLLGDEEGVRPRLATSVRALVVAAAVGAIVLSPAYLAFFVEGKGFTARTSAMQRSSAVEQGFLAPGALRTFASPSIALMKIEEPQRLWPKQPLPQLVSVYFGLAATGLALAALAAPRARFRFVVLAAGALFLAASLGPSLPVRGWLYDWVPPMRFFRFSAFQRGFGLFALAVLALWGSRDLAAPAAATRRRACLALGLAALGLGGLATVALRDVFAATAHQGRSLAVELGWVLATSVAVAVVGALGFRARAAARWLGLALVTLSLIETMRTLSVSPTLYSVPRPQHLEPLLQLETGRRRSPSLTLDRVGRTRPRTNLNLLAGEAHFPGYEPMTSPLRTTWMWNPRLTSWVVGPERIWFAPKATVRGSTPADLDAFIVATRAAGAPLLWIHDGVPADAGGLSDLPADTRCERIAVELLDYRQRDLAFRVEAPAAGWLWVTDRYAQGWKAFVDDVETDVHRAGFLFRAIEIPAGRHVVRMRYTPFGYPWLMALSWTTLLAVAVASVRDRAGDLSLPGWSRVPLGRPERDRAGRR